MTEKEQIKAAKAFAADWKDRGESERGEAQAFWLTLLREVFGVEKPENFIRFEDTVKLDHTSFIDGYIEATHVMIEQKKLGKDLRKGIRQSDGSVLSPFQQAKRYAAELPYSKRPRWIVTCNFAEFLVYDMEKPNGEPEQILLKDLPKEYYRLQFLVEQKSEMLKKEEEISLKASDLVGKLYDAILKQYKNPDSPETLKSLNILCVRFVFLLFAEDAQVFEKHQMFHHYLKRFEARDVRRALIELFKVLNTPEDERDPYLDDELKEFPYVNGGLFADENIEIPNFTDEIVHLLLKNASEDFDWSAISPPIFGGCYESTINPETRKSGGMHYTARANIHKVIDPLFLDDLKAELAKIKSENSVKKRKEDLWKYRQKLASLTFFDPACGSGNFLTETYISLRELEIEALQAEVGELRYLEGFEPILVQINQFYGIEINDFAVTVAKTALWIAELQMMRKTEEVMGVSIDPLPLKSNANIIEGNALRLDWREVVPVDRLNYIMGNPPFIGYSLQSKEQKDDILSVYVDENGKPYKTAGKIDYVAGWYFKAAQLMVGTDIKTAFVSTNSICQGEQVAGVWKPIFDRFGVHIDFAHQTFKWDNRGIDEQGKKKKTDDYMAAVHVVIVGFSTVENRAERRLYTSERFSLVKNINPYLIEAPDVFIESRTKPICNVPDMVYGNKPTDGGFLFLTPEEKETVIKSEPNTAKFIRQIYGATEYINNKERYCLWLVGASPDETRKSKFIADRVEKVRQFRLNSTKAATKESANTPTLFQEIRHPDTEYIIIPRHSSENRRYIPFGFVTPEIVVNDAVQIIPNAGLFHFGILMSNVHMSWVRAICGRIKSDYRYSKDIVYNNFPWCTPTEEQKSKIEATAQAIINARVLYPNSSLADLYDETFMPPELRKAHQANDFAVMAAYGFDRKITESECVAELMKMYQELTK